MALEISWVLQIRLALMQLVHLHIFVSSTGLRNGLLIFAMASMA